MSSSASSSSASSIPDGTPTVTITTTTNVPAESLSSTTSPFIPPPPPPPTDPATVSDHGGNITPNQGGNFQRDNLTSSPIYLFIFAIALGVLVILSFTIIIRSLILRRRMMRAGGVDFNNMSQFERLWFGAAGRPPPNARGGTGNGAGRRKRYGPKPIMTDVWIDTSSLRNSEKQNASGSSIGWATVQPFTGSIIHDPSSKHVSTNPRATAATVTSLLALRCPELIEQELQAQRLTNRRSRRNQTSLYHEEPPVSSPQSPFFARLGLGRTRDHENTSEKKEDSKTETKENAEVVEMEDTQHGIQSNIAPLISKINAEMDLGVLIRMPDRHRPVFNNSQSDSRTDEDDDDDDDDDDGEGEGELAAIEIGRFENVQLWKARGEEKNVA